MTTRPPVTCGGCGRLLKRAFYPDGRKHPRNDVYTRTLLSGEFVPSCSVHCANEVREAAGLPLIEVAEEEAA